MSPLPRAPVADTRRDDFIAEARRYVGVSEKPRNSNRGVKIDYWTEECGSPFGSAWCALFLHGVGVQAVGRKRWPFKRSGRVQEMVDDAIARGIFTKDRSVVKPGDLVVLWYPSLNRYGHVAVVTAFRVEGSTVFVESIDGNSNDDGSRDGYEVADKRGALARILTSRFAFILWPEM